MVDLVGAAFFTLGLHRNRTIPGGDAAMATVRLEAPAPASLIAFLILAILLAQELRPLPAAAQGLGDNNPELPGLRDCDRLLRQSPACERLIIIRSLAASNPKEHRLSSYTIYVIKLHHFRACIM
jgi:hypothetical protein